MPAIPERRQLPNRLTNITHGIAGTSVIPIVWHDIRELQMDDLRRER